MLAPRPKWLSHQCATPNFLHETPFMSATKLAAGSNWSKLKSKVVSTKKKDAIVPEKDEKADMSDNLSEKLKANYVGLDCEMVGIGLDGKQSALARCCLVNYDGEVIYDEFVRPPGFVTDFRTKYSGVRKKDLRQGTAITLLECQTKVADLIKDKVLVGHALQNDLDVLMLSHPRTMIRDTAKYRPYMRIHGKHGKVRPRALKDLTKEHLGLEIQAGEHDPGVDARCALFLYRKARAEWEQQLKDLKHAAKEKAASAQLLQQEQKQQQLLLQKAPTAAPSSAASTTATKKEPVLSVLRSEEKASTGDKKRKRRELLAVNAALKSRVDVEVQVAGAEESDGAEGGGDSDGEGAEDGGEVRDSRVSSAGAAAASAVVAGKKRKVSGRSGLISSRSSRNFQTVDAKLAAVKRARLSSSEGEGSGDTSARRGGMFAADGPRSGSAGSGGVARSIADVDRAMKGGRRSR